MHAALRIAAIFALSLQLALWINVVITFATSHFVGQPDVSASGATTVTALSFAMRLLLFTLLLLLTLANLGVDISTLLAGLGVGGIAVALALQSVLKDILGAITIVISKPFFVGDLIEVDEFIGEVQKVGMRSTQLINLSGEELTMPNQHLLDGIVRNQSRMRERRVSFVLTIHHTTPIARLDEVSSLLRDGVVGTTGARFERAQLKRLAPAGFEFEIVWYVASGDYDLYAATNHDLLFAILHRLDDRGIRLAAPIAATLADTVPG
jgi:small-conductance mechanosensitive channel